ncbi:MAG: RNA polymerase sigma factor region1.1 domain-containing protein, partial [Phycisphaerae bacterium]|nr:RNA polymerase sigma factor region1.1 domain-containing protein [Phycisphaerae bacterium]
MRDSVLCHCSRSLRNPERTPMAEAVDIVVKKLVAQGKARGYLTYEELNEQLPDDTASPDQLDKLLLS